MRFPLEQKYEGSQLTYMEVIYSLIMLNLNKDHWLCLIAFV